MKLLTLTKLLALDSSTESTDRPELLGWVEPSVPGILYLQHFPFSEVSLQTTTAA